MTAVPEDLVITLWHGFESFTITPVRGFLDVPTEIEATYDGRIGWQRDTPERLIRFAFGRVRFASTSLDEPGRAAAEIAAHLAALDGDWPGTTAHVVLLPVVDFSLTYEVTPQPRREEPPPPPPASVMEALAQFGLNPS